MNATHSDAERAKTIAGLNDHFRRNYGAGHTVITRGIQMQRGDFVRLALDAVRDFDAFTPNNDPHGEHDFGSFEIGGVECFWKIDCYDRKNRRLLAAGSPGAADPEVSIRVLTIMLVGEAYLVATGKHEPPPPDFQSDNSGGADNEERACNGELCIRSVPDRDDEEPDVLVIDAITDIMHLCARDGIDFDQCHRLAEHHFQAESETGGNYVHADAR